MFFKVSIITYQNAQREVEGRFAFAPSRLSVGYIFVYLVAKPYELYSNTTWFVAYHVLRRALP